MSTRETVDELLRRIAAGDPEQIAQLYAEEVDWRLDWPTVTTRGRSPGSATAAPAPAWPTTSG